MPYGGPLGVCTFGYGGSFCLTSRCVCVCVCLCVCVWVCGCVCVCVCVVTVSALSVSGSMQDEAHRVEITEKAGEMDSSDRTTEHSRRKTPRGLLLSGRFGMGRSQGTCAA